MQKMAVLNRITDDGVTGLSDCIYTNEYIEAVVDKYADMLFSIEFMMLRNRSDVQDTIQDIFVKLIEKPRKFENDDHEKEFLIRTMLKLCKDHSKLQRFKKEIPLTDNLTYLLKEQDQLLLSVMTLPEKYRSVLIIFYYNDYSIAEIAKITGRRQATVGSQLQRPRGSHKVLLKRC